MRRVATCKEDKVALMGCNIGQCCHAAKMREHRKLSLYAEDRQRWPWSQVRHVVAERGE